MRKLKLFSLLLMLFMGLMQLQAADVTSTYTLSANDAGASVNENIQNVNWSWGTSDVGKGNGTNPMIKVVGTITVTLPSGAELKSVRAELNNANNWGNSVTLKFKAGSTELVSWAKNGSSNAVTITSNKTNGTYTFVGNGNAWVKSLSVTYSGGSQEPSLLLDPTSKEFEATGNSAQAIALTASNFASAVNSVTCAFFSNAECTSSISRPSWVNEPTVNNAKTQVSVNVEDNDGAARQTWMKITASDGSKEASAVLAITQAKYTAPTGTFVKYTGGSLVEGDYVIYGSSTHSYAMKNTITSSRFDPVSITPEDDEISNPDESLVWHIAPSATAGYWTIYSEDVSKYAGGSTTNNQATLLDASSSDYAKWSISISNGVATISNKGRGSDRHLLQINNDNNKWGLFTSGNTNPTLYKKALPTHAVTFTAAPTGGTVTVSAGSAINSGAQVEEGTTVTVTPTPSQYYRLVSVTKGGQAITPVQGVYSFTMPTSDVAIAVTFEYIPVTNVTVAPASLTLVVGESSSPLSATVLPNNALGTVTWSSANSNIASVNSETGIVTAVAASENPVNIIATSTVTGTISGTCAVTVNAATGSPITILTATGGEVTASVDVADVLEGTQVTLTATPADGYSLSGWTVIDENADDITPTSQSGNTFIFNMPGGEVTVEASFTHEVAVLKLHDANGESTFDSENTHYWKESVTLPTSAATCSKTFVGWSADENRATAPELAKGASYTIPNKGANNDLYAVYATISGGGTSTTNIAYTNTETTTNMSGENEAELLVEGDATGWSVVGAAGSASNNVGLNKAPEIRMYGHASGNGNTITITAPQTISTVDITFKGNNNNAWVKVAGETVDLTDGVYPINATSFVVGNANTGTTQVIITNIAVNFTTSGTPSGYTTTCAVSPTATVDPEAVEASNAAVEKGVIDVTYQNVKMASVSVARFNDEACKEPFDGEWLTASLNDDKDIAYTISENTSYNDVRTAYIKLTAPQVNEATDPAVVVIPVTQAKKPAVFNSLQALVDADVNANTEVTVTFEDIPIKEFYYYPENSQADADKKGIVFEISKAGNNIKIYFSSAAVPDTWVTGGKVSGELTNCPWKTYDSKWQLAPKSGWAWSNLGYVAPPEIKSIKIGGTATNKTYIDGQVFNPAGLTVTAIYDNDYEEDVTSYATWTYNPAKLSTTDSQVEVTAEYNNNSDSETITGLTVNAIPNKTVDEFIAAGGTRCYLEGIVSNIETVQAGTPKVAGYFDLTDADEHTIHIYKCLNASGVENKFDEIGVKNGDKVKIIAETYEYYNNETHQAKNVQYVSHISPVEITIEDKELAVGQEWMIEATTDPAGAVDNISYIIKDDGTSSDFVTLGNSGVVTGKAGGTATIVASIPAGEGYLANSVEFTVTVIPMWKVQFSVNGIPDQNLELYLVDGAAIEFPTTVSLSGTSKQFVGWTTVDNAEYSHATDAPAFVTSATATADVTYYAVFADLVNEGAYEKLTSTTSLAAGDKLVITNGSSKGMLAYESGNNCGETSIEISNDVITNLGDAAELTLGGVENEWTLFDGTYYLYDAGTTNNNHLKGVESPSTEDYTWEISIENEVSKVRSHTNTNKPDLQYNNSSKIFACYKNSQSAITLFKKADDEYANYATTVALLDHIAITTVPKTAYKVGETLDLSDMVVKAYYGTDETGVEISDYTVSIEAETALTTEHTSFTVTYSEGGLNKTVIQAIHVYELSGIAVTAAPGETVKTDYKDGQSFDKSKIVVTATWGGDAEDKIVEAVAAANYVVSPDPLVYNSTTQVVVSYTHAGIQQSADPIDVTVADRDHYVVTWSVAGAETTTKYYVEDDALVVKADPEVPEGFEEGFEFMGWTKEESINKDGSEIDYAQDGDKLTGATTYRAVFAKGETTNGYKVGTAAPADGETVIIARLVESTYYALNYNGTSLTTTALSVTDGFAPEPADEVLWDIKDATTGVFIHPTGEDDLRIHINSKEFKVATGDTNGDVVFSANSSNDSYKAARSDNQRWIGVSGETGLSYTDAESNAAELYIFKSHSVTNYSNYRFAPAPQVAPTMSFPEASYNANLGKDFEEPELSIDPDGLPVTYSSSVKTVATVNENTGEISLVGEGTTIITATFEENEDYAGNTATYTLNVIDATKDVLTASAIAVSGTSYTAWSKSFTSEVVYAGNTTNGTGTDHAGTIQMRKDQGSGIVVTSSIGYLKALSATATKNGSNTLEIYAKGTAYESAADLHDADKRGDLIGTIAANGGAIVFDGTKSYADNYKYIGIKANGGAVYYDAITIEWTPAEFEHFDVTYKAGEAEGLDVVESIEEGSLISLKAANTFTAPEGKMFAGWLLEGEENAREAGSKYAVTAAATFTAQWVQVYTITYLPGEAEGEPVVVENVPVGNYSLAANTFEAPESKEFAGWKLNNEGESLAAGANYNVTGNASFTAQWSIIKQPAGLAYTTTSYMITRGRSFEAPELTNPYSLAVTYSGNNDAVATVDAATGAITLQGGIGTVTVTATSAETDYYYAGEASYTLKVKDANLSGGWVRLTNGNTLVAGMKVIVAQYVSSQNGTIKTMGGQNTNNRAEVAGTLQNDTLISDEGTEILTLVAIKNTTNFALKTADNKYLYAAGSGSGKNYLKSKAKVDGDATWAISLSADGKATITAQGDNTNNKMQYNQSNTLFSCYASTSQKEIALYSKTIAVSEGDVNASTLEEYADVVVADNATLVINEGTKPLGNITGNVEVNAPLQAEGVHLGVTNTMTVNSTVNVPSFSISVQLGSTGQATNVNVDVEHGGSIAAPEGYVDMELSDNANPNHWHSFTVPFEVDALNGIYDAETGAPLQNEVNYAIMDYHGDIRANGDYGWKKYRGTLQPGTFYLITIDGNSKVLRFMKKEGSKYIATNDTVMTYYGGQGYAGASTDFGWCGVGNRNMFNGYVPETFVAQVLNAAGTGYEPIDADDAMSACIPFFIQVTATVHLVMATSAPDPNVGAPRRVAAKGVERMKVFFGNENYTDRLYISASEEATNEYEIGKDLVKMTMSNTPVIPQIFGKAYGNKLCMVYAPMSNDQAVYDLTLYAPNAGEYVISCQPSAISDQYIIYLTKDGNIIWNLTMSEYPINLNKGNTEGYGLLLKAKAPQTPTGVEQSEVSHQPSDIQKIIINDNVFILRGGQMYDVTGKAVK